MEAKVNETDRRKFIAIKDTSVCIFAILGTLALTITGLILGASLLIPLSISLLLFVLLTAIFRWFARRKVLGLSCPRWLAHVLGISAVFLGLFVIVMILGRQAELVEAAVPQYQERFASIVAKIVSAVGEENAKMVKEKLSGIDLSGIAVAAVDQAGGFFGGLMLVVLYVAFMMAERRAMERKLPIALGDNALHSHIVRILKEIAAAMQLYVGVKTLCCTLTGLGTFIVLRLINLDFSETWGLLAFALNFIPTLGAILAISLPALVALVQFETLGQFLFVVVGCGIVQFLVGGVLEPMIMGRRLNLAPFMVILSLVFWGTLWGIAGAFLSVPITVCLLIVFGHIEATRPVAVLMSGDGTLPTLQSMPDPKERASQT